MTDTILQFAVSVVAILTANYFVFKSLKNETTYTAAPVLDSFEKKTVNFFEKQYILKVKKRYTHQKISAKDYKFPLG